MQKKTILHFIFNLERGGAETMLVGAIRELKEYKNIVVTIRNENHYDNELECDKYISLNLKSTFAFPLAINKLKKIIEVNNVDIVHSHLFWPTVIARIGVPKKIPLITTIHQFIATTLDYKKWYIRSIDRFTYKLRKSVIVTVAKGAQDDYFSFLKLKPHKTYVLYTFVDIERYSQKKNANETGTFKLISVGALSAQKNQSFLVKAMSLIKDSDIILDIYGSGPLESQLQQLINKTGAKIVLRGMVKNIEEVLPLYNAFVMASAFEGFSLAVLEAMAIKLPLLLSDIESFKEQCGDTAVLFKLNNTDDFIKKLNYLIANPEMCNKISENAYQKVLQNFTLKHHVSGLRKIYKDAILKE